jgi:hypothetical protein
MQQPMRHVVPVYWLMVVAVNAQHSNPAQGATSGGHISFWHGEEAAKPCVPVMCDGSEHTGALHGEGTAVHQEMLMGCTNVTIFNFMTNASEVLSMTCQQCVPKQCNVGEHDCTPVFCLHEDGTVHGGHSHDPCEAGHHSNDGLGWWPFLLFAMLVAISTTSFLKSLARGACCGKSFNPPFTVMMFIFGYVAAKLAQSHEENKIISGAQYQLQSLTDQISESILTWENAHPHVILFVLLPPLLFEDASSMDYYVFRKVLASSVILAGPGVLVTMLLCACCTMLLWRLTETLESRPYS